MLANEIIFCTVIASTLFQVVVVAMVTEYDIRMPFVHMAKSMD